MALWSAEAAALRDGYNAIDSDGLAAGPTGLLDRYNAGSTAV